MSSGCTSVESYCTSAFAAINATNTVFTPAKEENKYVKIRILLFFYKTVPLILRQCFSIAITQDAHVIPLMFRYVLLKLSSGTNILKTSF